MSKNVPHTCIIVGPGTIKNDKEQLLLNGPLHAEGYLKSSTTILKRSRKSEIMICIWKNISVGLISINFKLNRLKRFKILFKILSRYRFKKKVSLNHVALSLNDNIMQSCSVFTRCFFKKWLCKENRTVRAKVKFNNFQLLLL